MIFHFGHIGFDYSWFELSTGNPGDVNAVAFRTLVYSTAEYCAPVLCRSVHTRLIDSVLYDARGIVTGYLRPTTTDHLPILASIQPAGLLRLGATLLLANRSVLDPDHLLHNSLVSLLDARKRLKSRRPFVSTARKLLDNTSELDIRVIVIVSG